MEQKSKLRKLIHTINSAQINFITASPQELFKSTYLGDQSTRSILAGIRNIYSRKQNGTLKSDNIRAFTGKTAVFEDSRLADRAERGDGINLPAVTEMANFLTSFESTNTDVHTFMRFFLQPKIWNKYSPVLREMVFKYYSLYILKFSELTNQFILRYLPGRAYLDSHSTVMIQTFLRSCFYECRHQYLKHFD